MCTSQPSPPQPVATVEAQAFKIPPRTRKVGEAAQSQSLAGASNVSVTQASFGGRSTFGGDQKLQPGLGGGGGSGVTTPLGGARAEGGVGGGFGAGGNRGAEAQAYRQRTIEIGGFTALGAKQRYAA